MADPGVVGLALIAVAVLVGAGTQRITGLGFALVSAPFLVLLLGPFTGVLLANALSLVSNLVVLAQTRRAVETRRALLLAVPALIAIVPGAWVARTLPAPLLAITAGGLVLVALIAVLASERARVLRGTPGAVTAGVMSGFMNVTAGVGGPAISLYALSTGWAHRSFVATVQLYFVLLNAASIAAKGWPDLSPATWVVAGGALALGAAAGHRLARLVPPDRARALVAFLAILGSAATVGKALVEL
ncbi:sulfite exporter TauE/SafE family protein [Pseudonocardia nigra]|uniref:sulfite exporter TauE/SafE family protein n=1 Tax=Pseudonocardia nigra TaxID=1921578 RepID=UPI001C5FA82C|nr:sulfite exporter TauE/SafE family protein [Pseudonocardia nigra]